MKRRAEGPANTRPLPIKFRPRHCAGPKPWSPWSCMHAHPGETPVTAFPAVFPAGGAR